MIVINNYSKGEIRLASFISSSHYDNLMFILLLVPSLSFIPHR